MCAADAVDAADAPSAGESVVKTVLKLFSQRSTAHKYYFSPMTSALGLISPFTHPVLMGYIKDNAWAYEKEYRIRVETDPNEKHDAVAIGIPQEVLDSFEFITGPRYDHNFTAVLRRDAEPRLKPKVQESLFTGRLKWVYCDSCKYKTQPDHDQQKTTL